MTVLDSSLPSSAYLSSDVWATPEAVKEPWEVRGQGPPLPPGPLCPGHVRVWTPLHPGVGTPVPQTPVNLLNAHTNSKPGAGRGPEGGPRWDTPRVQLQLHL